MHFQETTLPGSYVIEPEAFRDERGWFARAYCAHEFAEHDLEPLTAQSNLSFNVRAGTVRGLHFQRSPAAEAKLVRCVRGRIYDVLVDLRPDSPTHRRWFGVELDDRDHRALYVPPLFAHGFQTLADDTLVHYQVSEFYTPEVEGGIRYDDPAIGISWPREVTAVSEKDAGWDLLGDDGPEVVET